MARDRSTDERLLRDMLMPRMPAACREKEVARACVWRHRLESGCSGVAGADVSLSWSWQLELWRRWMDERGGGDRGAMRWDGLVPQVPGRESVHEPDQEVRREGMDSASSSPPTTTCRQQGRERGGVLQGRRRKGGRVAGGGRGGEGRGGHQ